MNIVVDLIGADTRLSLESIQTQYVVVAAAESMAREMDTEAKSRGFDIVADDVHVWRREQTVFERAHNVVSYGAVWAPDPMGRGVELFGGSHDGEILHVARAEGPGRSMPPALLVVASEPMTHIETGEPTGMPNEGVPVEEYLRAGIDSTNRRFVYKIKVSQ